MAGPEDWLTSEEGKAALENLEGKGKADSLSAEPAKEPPKATTAPAAQTPAVKTVRLKTPEGEFDVPEPVAKGWFRQEDYTRKTQDLSRQAQELRSKKYSLEAFEANPEAWIKQHRPEILAAEPEPKDAEPEPKDAGEKALRRVESLEHERRVDTEVQRLENELNFLSREYPDLYSRAEVLDFAEKNGYESAIQAFRDLNFDRVRLAARSSDQERKPDLVGATGMVSEPADRSTPAPAPEGPPKTDKEALERALKYAETHGLYQ